MPCRLSGSNLDPTGAGSMDLTAAFAAGPIAGLPNEGMYEGFLGILSTTGSFPPGSPYDLLGRNWQYTAVGADLAGAAYIMTPLP